MLHACVQRFDVTGNLEKFCKILGTKQSHILLQHNKLAAVIYHLKKDLRTGLYSLLMKRPRARPQPGNGFGSVKSHRIGSGVHS